jgi:hypothetical protein
MRCFTHTAKPMQHNYCHVIGRGLFRREDKIIFMQQTAVEWLCSQIYTIQVELEAGNNHLKNKIDKAKAMEKQQIIDACNYGDFEELGEQYYNETYKK